MADIPIERRSGGDWWKWLGGLALLVVVILLIVSLTDTDGNGVDDTIDQPLEQEQEQQQPPQQDQQQQQDQQTDPPTEQSSILPGVQAEPLPLIAAPTEAHA